VILPAEAWMDIRRYAPLRAAGAAWKEIGAAAGCDWRTARKYLSAQAPTSPPRAPSRAGTVPRKVDRFVGVIDAWLAADPRLRASVIHERLVAQMPAAVQLRGMPGPAGPLPRALDAAQLLQVLVDLGLSEKSLV
jgi:hypothetical protein